MSEYRLTSEGKQQAMLSPNGPSRTRTGMPCERRGILSPLRLPIPPRARPAERSRTTRSRRVAPPLQVTASCAAECMIHQSASVAALPREPAGSASAAPAINAGAWAVPARPTRGSHRARGGSAASLRRRCGLPAPDAADRRTERGCAARLRAWRGTPGPHRSRP